MKMPFGKYRDWPLAAVPLSYLAWLLEEATLTPQLRTAVAAEVRRRVAPLCPGCNGHGEIGRLLDATAARVGEYDLWMPAWYARRYG
jgi:hypothetical protein